jgi:hypothetical protein
MGVQVRRTGRFGQRGTDRHTKANTEDRDPELGGDISA